MTEFLRLIGRHHPAAGGPAERAAACSKRRRAGIAREPSNRCAFTNSPKLGEPRPCLLATSMLLSLLAALASGEDTNTFSAFPPLAREVPCKEARGAA